MNKDFSQVINAGYATNCLMQENNKVRDHCHATGKYRGSAHWSLILILN